MEDDLLEEFVKEAKLHLDGVEEDILSLNSQSFNEEQLNNLLRSVHSIKGGAGFLKLSSIVKLTHRLESVFKKLLDKSIPFSDKTGKVLLSGIDKLKFILEDTAKRGDERHIAEVLENLEKIIQDATVTPVVQSNLPNPGTKDETRTGKGSLEKTKELIDKLEQRFFDLDRPDINKAEVFKQLLTGFEILYDELQKENIKNSINFCLEIIDLLSHFNENDISLTSDVIVFFVQSLDSLRKACVTYDESNSFVIPEREALSQRIHEINASAGFSRPPFPAGGSYIIGNSNTKKASGKQDLRVDVDKLDLLLNLIGEQAIAQAMVINHPLLSRTDDERIDKSIHHLKRVSSELQTIAMSIRMIPLAGVLRKMLRVVHDLSEQLGKKVKLNIIGEDTTIDKNIIEKISDPLIHLVRNAVDHGIENPSEREIQQKQSIGQISIEARSEAGEVTITVKDDGRGLDRQHILEKAIERGLCSKEESKDISAERIYDFIFEPGLSTAKEVTDISGRGVGLDVVKSNIENLKGWVEIHSELHRGTMIVLHLPLTLAIIEGMLVRVGDSQYTIPLLSILESFKASDVQLFYTPDFTEWAKIRDKVIPVLRLSLVFGKASGQAPPHAVLVIVQYEGKYLCLLVDEILGQQETVVKPLPEYLKPIKSISGCTILGNGSVSLILDISELVKIFLCANPDGSVGKIHFGPSS